MALWIGTSGFQYPEWKGTFYPEKLSPAKMLPFYAEHFNTTEINYSFRRIPSEKTIAGWAAATPGQFKFSFKAPQKVTHFAKLHGSADTMHYFHTVVVGLGQKLGAVLFQLPPTFEKDAERLGEFLRTLPKEMRAAFEFRHPSWFDDEVYEILRSANAALCIAESETLSTPPIFTASFGYFRLRREDYSPEDIERWSRLILDQHRWQEVFVYFKHEERGIGPQFARQLIELVKGGS